MNFWSWLLAQNSKPNKHYCCLDECLMCTIIWDNFWKVGECAYPFFWGLIFHKNKFCSRPTKTWGSEWTSLCPPIWTGRSCCCFCCSHGRGTSCNFWHWRTTWRSTLNKNQLRNQLRKYIQVKRKHHVVQLESWHLFWKTPDHLRLIDHVLFVGDVRGGSRCRSNRWSDCEPWCHGEGSRECDLQVGR